MVHPKPDAFCLHCGKALPWTEMHFAAIREIAEYVEPLPVGIGAPLGYRPRGAVERHQQSLRLLGSTFEMKARSIPLERFPRPDGDVAQHQALGDGRFKLIVCACWRPAMTSPNPLRVM